MRLILASTSARRRKILAFLGLPFEMIPPNFSEVITEHRPLEEEVQDFAMGKAESVARDIPDGIVIGSDTMILLGGRKIGKPTDPQHAREILQSLRGETHQILTGLAILNTKKGTGLRHLERVMVRMRAYTEEEMDRYISLGEFQGKAGAYSLQGEGRSLIESLSGDYLAAVGLPLRPIAAYLKKEGISIPLDVERFYAERAFLNGGKVI